MARNNRRTFLKTVSGVLSTSSVGSGIAISKETDNNRQTKPSKLTRNQSEHQHKDRKNKSATSGPSPYPKLSWAMDLNGGMHIADPVLADEMLFLAVTTQNGPVSGKGYVAAHDPVTGNEIWKETDLPAPRTPIVSDGNLYFSTSVWEDFTEGGFFALDADTGERKWSRTDHLVWSDPVVTSDRLFTVKGQALNDEGEVAYALDSETGDTLWTYEDVSSFRQRVSYVDGTVFYRDGTALNAEDGSIVWRVTDENFTLYQTGDKLVYGIRSHPDHQTIEARSMKDGTIRWTAQTNTTDLRSIRLTVIDKTLLFIERTDEDSIITAYKPKSGKQIWQRTSTLPVAGDLVIANKRLLFRSGKWRPRKLTALDAKTGEQAWNHDFPAFLFSGPVIADETAYVGGRYEPVSNYSKSRAFICAIDVTSGERKWSYLIDDLDQRTSWDGEPPAAGTPVLADGRLYTATYPAGSTLDYEYTHLANLIALESTDQQPDTDHRLPGGEPPEACIEASPDPAKTDLDPGDCVILDASCSIDPEGSDLRYQWAVDDEFESYEDCIEVAVPARGEKAVRVWVTDSDGYIDVENITISAN
ncbi:PQQ-binding-like beta-propeller repeat protein [Haladaptatus sp. W1]|uniref:PQQ-binding-like beta-propeller repeat protein n=1 Tax=Haladaptatus sp. W1 TaxID=1897478 RepID=UPI0009F5F787|nr:PQQ-binding-like beta-propeller repeat protein [Haladaptatus sp. W1]